MNKDTEIEFEHAEFEQDHDVNKIVMPEPTYDEVKAEPIHNICKNNNYSNDITDTDTINASEYYKNKLVDSVCTVLKTAQMMANKDIENTTDTKTTNTNNDNNNDDVNSHFDEQYKQNLENNKINSIINEQNRLSYKLHQLEDIVNGNGNKSNIEHNEHTVSTCDKITTLGCYFLLGLLTAPVLNLLFSH